MLFCLRLNSSLYSIHWESSRGYAPFCLQNSCELIHSSLWQVAWAESWSGVCISSCGIVFLCDVSGDCRCWYVWCLSHSLICQAGLVQLCRRNRIRSSVCLPQHRLVLLFSPRGLLMTTTTSSFRFCFSAWSVPTDSVITWVCQRTNNFNRLVFISWRLIHSECQLSILKQIIHGSAWCW